MRNEVDAVEGLKYRNRRAGLNSATMATEHRRRLKRLQTFRTNERLFASFHVSLQMSAMRKLQHQRDLQEKISQSDQLTHSVAAKRVRGAQGIARGRLRQQVQQDHLLKRVSPSPLNNVRVEFSQSMVVGGERTPQHRPRPRSCPPSETPPRSELITSDYDVFQHPNPQRGLLAPWPSVRFQEAAGHAVGRDGALHSRRVSTGLHKGLLDTETITRNRRPWSAAADNLKARRLEVARCQPIQQSTNEEQQCTQTGSEGREKPALCESEHQKTDARHVAEASGKQTEMQGTRQFDAQMEMIDNAASFLNALADS